MNWMEAEHTVYKTFGALWAGRTPVDYANTDDPQFPIKDGRSWISMDVLFVSTEASIGANKIYRHQGVVIFSIFTPQGSGTGESVKLFTKISHLLRDKIIDNIVYNRPSGDYITDKIENYHRTLFHIGFYVEEQTYFSTENIPDLLNLSFYAVKNSGLIPLL